MTSRRALVTACVAGWALVLACASPTSEPAAPPALDYGSCSDSVQAANAAAYGSRGVTQTQLAPREVRWEWAAFFDGYSYSAWYVLFDGRAAACVVSAGYMDP
jgi:hypothetical protein